MPFDVKMKFKDGVNLKELARQFPKVEVRSLNKIAKSTKAYVSREIRKTYNIKKSDLDPNFKIIKARPSRRIATLFVRGRPLPVILFKARPTTSGVAVQIRRGRRKIIRAAFVATGKKTGRVNVFRRKGRSQFPISMLQTIGVDKMFASHAIFEKLRRFVDENMRKFFDRELNFEMVKAQRKR